jgi:Lrp/AsnC family leucine-responsive transcriptional regulator
MIEGFHSPTAASSLRLDATDRRILTELAGDGRVSLAELGRRVSLSSPAVGERVQRLERAGVITGYHAAIDPRALGFPLQAIVRIRPAARQLPKIPELAEQIPQVAECLRVTGEDCFVLTIHLRSMDELSGLLDRFLAYGETTTSIVSATPIPRRGAPIE